MTFDKIKEFIESRRFYWKKDVEHKFHTATICHSRSPDSYSNYMNSTDFISSNYAYRIKAMLTEIMGHEKGEWIGVKYKLKLIILTDDNGDWPVIAKLQGWEELIDNAVIEQRFRPRK